MEMLDEQIIYRNGPFMRVKQWFRGPFPEKGTLTFGFTGLETIVEKTVIRPLYSFQCLRAETNHG